MRAHHARIEGVALLRALAGPCTYGPRQKNLREEDSLSRERSISRAGHISSGQNMYVCVCVCMYNVSLVTNPLPTAALGVLHHTHFTIPLKIEMFVFDTLMWVCLSDRRMEKSTYYIPAEHRTDAKVPRLFPSACWVCLQPAPGLISEEI